MNNRLLVSTRKGIFIFERQGKNWSIAQTVFLGDPATLCMSSNDGKTLRAALDLGHFGCKMHRSDDGGETWKEVSCPVYPKKPDAIDDDIDPVQNKALPWALKKVWSFAEGGGRIWCGTIPGALFVSNDEGDTWEIVNSLWLHPMRKKWFGGGADYPGIHSIIIDPRDANHVTIGVSCGGVWVTRDGGESWNIAAKGMRAEYMPPDQVHEENAQDPHMIVGSPSSPDTLWCQHHNGIFITHDDCASWQEIKNVSPSVFGFPVVVHPTDPNKAWFIPAIKDEARYPVDGQLVVNRTDDGGKTFQTLRTGLPQEHVYDIVYRHAFSIDDSGDQLAFGSTTGSLWVSHNGGDNWMNLSTHLPPIYAVMFI